MIPSFPSPETSLSSFFLFTLLPRPSISPSSESYQIFTSFSFSTFQAPLQVSSSSSTGASSRSFTSENCLEDRSRKCVPRYSWSSWKNYSYYILSFINLSSLSWCFVLEEVNWMVQARLKRKKYISMKYFLM